MESIDRHDYGKALWARDAGDGAGDDIAVAPQFLPEGPADSVASLGVYGPATLDGE